jgi:hypothetical protein
VAHSAATCNDRDVRPFALALVLSACATVPTPAELAPRFAPSPTEDAAAPAFSLLEHVGARTTASPASFALALASGLGAIDGALLAIDDGAALLDAAVARGAVFRAGRPMPGDLVVFGGGAVVGMVNRVTENGAVEFVYAQRKVVRRGLVSPDTDKRRDKAGAALNTFVGPAVRESHPSRRALASQLFDGWIRLTDLR